MADPAPSTSEAPPAATRTEPCLVRLFNDETRDSLVTTGGGQVFVPTHALHLVVDSSDGDDKGPRSNANRVIILVIDASSSMQGKLFRRVVEVAYRMGCRAYDRGFGAVYMIKYSDNAQLYTSQTKDELTAQCRAHFAECGGRTNFIEAFDCLGRSYATAASHLGDRVSIHSYFLTDGQHFTGKAVSAADALQICTPAIQKLANRRESVVARGGACESSALVVTDGTIPLMQSVVSENGVMIYASSSREFLERSDELVGLVESFSQSVSARVAPVGYVFPSGEPMREVQLAVDPVSGTASANLFLLRDASVADADLPEAITTVLLTAAHETTSDAPALPPMVDVPIVDGLIRNAEVEEVLEADTVFGLIDNSDAPSRNDQQRKLKSGIPREHVYDVCVIALAVLEGRVDWVEAGLSNVSSGIIALQRLATAEERAARAGALMHDAAVLREIYKMCMAELVRIKGRHPDADVLDAYRAHRDEVLERCKMFGDRFQQVLEALNTIHASGAALDNNALKFHVQNTYTTAPTNKARASRFAVRQQRNTELLERDFERLEKAKKKGALEEVSIPYDHPAARDLICPISLEGPTDGPMVLTLQVGTGGGEERAEVWIDDPSLTDIVGPGRFLSYDTLMDVVEMAINQGRGGLESVIGDSVMAIEGFRGALPCYLFKEHWEQARWVARAAMGFTVTGAVNGYAKNQLETIPYLAAMRCLSGRINEFSVKRFLIVRRTITQILRDFGDCILYERSIAQFSDPEKRMSDATGASLEPVLVYKMLNARDEDEMRTFIVQLLEEDIRRAVKQAMRDFAPKMVDKIAGVLIGAYSLAREAIRARADTAGSDPDPDAQAVPLTDEGVTAYMEAVIERLRATKAAKKRERNQKRSERRRKRREALESQGGTGPATGDAASADVEAGAGVGGEAEGGGDGPSGGESRSDDRNVFGWTPPEGFPRALPGSRRTQADVKAFLRDVARRLRWTVAKTHRALAIWHALAALPKDTNSILEENFGYPTEELVATFRNALPDGMLTDEAWPYAAVDTGDDGDDDGGDDGVDGDDEEVVGEDVIGGTQWGQIFTSCADLLETCGLASGEQAMLATVVQGLLETNVTSTFRKMLASGTWVSPMGDPARALTEAMGPVRISNTISAIDQAADRVNISAVVDLLLATRDPTVFAGLLRRYGEYASADAATITFQLQRAFEAVSGTTDQPVWKIRLAFRRTFLTAPGQAGCLHVPLIKGVWTEVPEERKHHPAAAARKRIKYVYQRMLGVDKSKKWWRQTFSQDAAGYDPDAVVGGGGGGGGGGKSRGGAGKSGNAGPSTVTGMRGKLSVSASGNAKNVPYYFR